MRFDDLGFAFAYELELDPEFPGDGRWRVPTAGVDPQGDPCEFLTSRWTDPVVVRFRPRGGEARVLSFAGSRATSFSGVFATPNATTFLAICSGSAVLVDTQADRFETTALDAAIAGVARWPDEPVVLLWTFSELLALDAEGVRWATERLCWDDLASVAFEGPIARCTGSEVNDAPFAVDLRTGQRVGGAWAWWRP